MSVSQSVEIINKYGFHVRPTSAFTKLALTFKSAIKVQFESTVVDGKSIMGLMTLGAMKGAVITVTADGADEEEAVKQLVALVEDRFGGID